MPYKRVNQHTSRRKDRRAVDEDNARKILSLVCEQLMKDGGSKQVGLSSLLKSPNVQVSRPAQLYSFLSRFPTLFELIDGQDLSTGGKKCYVRPKIGAELCPTHSSSGGSCTGLCGKIHICRFFLMGDGVCKYDSKCRNGHDFKTGRNKEILTNHLLNELSIAQLRVFLNWNKDQSVNPDSPKRVTLSTCKFYNVGSAGCSNVNCPYLHVCAHHIAGRCKFGARCKRSHDIREGKNLCILEDHGIDASRMSPNQLMQTVRDNLESKEMDGPMSRPQSVSSLYNPPLGAQRNKFFSTSGMLFPATSSASYGGARPKSNQNERIESSLSEQYRNQVFMGGQPWPERKASSDFSVDLPHFWKKGLKYEKDFEKVQIDPKSEEYKEIKEMVIGNLAFSKVKRTVVSVERIQNPENYDKFTRKKNWMGKKTLCPESSLERRLFHGTKHQYVDIICRQGFDFRLSGKSTGTKFGKGTYFSASAKYSLCYSDSNMLFICKVLVGDYTKGSPELTRPPAKDRQNPEILYDSCVDDPESPGMFVVYTLDQSYPEYLVTLSGQ